MARLHAGEAPLVARRFAGGPAAHRSAPWCRAGCSRLPDAADVSGTLLAHPSSRIAVPVVLGVGQRADSGFDVVPATLVVERSPNRRRDERAALTPTNPAVESMHDFVVETYVQTHGHKLAHTVIRPTFYRLSILRCLSAWFSADVSGSSDSFVSARMGGAGSW